ncbi:hypothetical protein GCK72_019318 [Caenorhabditis remanei]|uniref:CX domain-containing protein n=1 Tax=Caenorhabditis remanei TaxID=31234 RepID=A0A6A5GDL2_CAERE|nr:hypothetical protein GCK72_019318 [Caenorhabditis remanei]KAF1752763.1 hypothetical protein GCK72_019318 [Caenorhabditis remanei]
MRFLYLLSVLVVIHVAPFEQYTEYFRFTGEGIAYIEDPDVPMKIGSTTYYWDGHFKATIGRPVLCEIKIDSYVWPFGDVRYENGTKPIALNYACPEKYNCGVMTCLSDDIRSPLIISVIIILCVVVGILNICYCCRKVEEEEYLEMAERNGMVLSAIDEEGIVDDGVTESFIDEDSKEHVFIPPTDLIDRDIP